MDKVESLNVLLAKLAKAIEEDKQADAQCVAQQIDAELRALDKDEIAKNQEVLGDIAAQMLAMVSAVEVIQSEVKKQIATFNSNTSKLKAYHLPR